MEKYELLQTLKHISDSYFQKKDYISAGQINLAIDVVNDYDGVLPQANDIKSVCVDCLMGRDEFEPDWKCPECRRQTVL